MINEQLDLVEQLESVDSTEIESGDALQMPAHPPLDPKLTALRRWMDDNGFEVVILNNLSPVELVISEILKRLFMAEIAINALMKVSGDNE